MPTPDAPFVILDQNRLRDARHVEAAFKHAATIGGKVLVPDAALMEMMKGPKWDDATRRSLELLAKQPDLVAVAWSTGDLLRRERNKGTPTLDLVDEEVTGRFRQLLRKIVADPATALGDVAPLVADAQDMAKRQWLDHEKNKQRVLNMVKTWKELLSADGLKRLRSEKDLGLFCDLLASDQMTRLLKKWLQGSGDYPEEAIELLATQPSIISHVCLCHAALALRWLRDSGAENVPAEKLTNDVVDMEYVLLGTFCASLDSADKKVIEMLGIVKRVAEQREQSLVEPVRQ